MTIRPKKFYLPRVEFYITNVCNFNCDGCNRFNNYTFSGRQKWVDYQEDYRKWSTILDFDQCRILGGEPMTSPDFKEWITGILGLWPDRQVILLTNGSLLDKQDRDLYQLFQDNANYLSLDIGLHNQTRIDSVLHTVKDWLMGPLEVTRFPEEIDDIEGFQQSWQQSWQHIRDPSWPLECDYHEWDNFPDWIKNECETVHGFSPRLLKDKLQSYCIRDVNGVTVKIKWENFFHQGALIVDHDQKKFRLHNSDPVRAHDICHSKTCHHFDSGKLYKCGQVGLLPQFYQQFYMDISEQDRELMFGYQPATLEMTHDQLSHWLGQIDQPMPQCKFCPETYHMTEIFAKQKKIFFQKKRKNQNRDTVDQ